MPKSAPRRKRIRTARAEVDPTNLSSTTIASNNSSLKISAESSSSSSKQNKGQQSGKKKINTAGQEREKHLGPVLDKVCFHSLRSNR